MLDAAGAYAQFAIDSPSAFSVMQRLELTRADPPNSGRHANGAISASPRSWGAYKQPVGQRGEMAAIC